MKTSSPRVTRLSRRARILLSVAGLVVVIALVAVALLAFDRPLLARLTGNLPGEAIVSPEGSSADWKFCAYQGLWNTCSWDSYCEADPRGSVIDVAYGVTGHWYTKYAITGGICCNDASIGYDPAYGQEKLCYMQPH